MAYVIADHIISPLGETSEENYLSVRTGKSMLHTYESGSKGVQNAFCASLLSDSSMSRLSSLLDREDGTEVSMGHFERLALVSARKAIHDSKIDLAKYRVIFVLSTTKGNVENLGVKPDEENYLGLIAQRVAAVLGIHTKPIVVCNACISGLSALILASRLLDAGTYDCAVVCGADSPGKFVISGFQSLKALSIAPCRPFDMERCGLNLGEAAATMVLCSSAVIRAEEKNDVKDGVSFLPRHVWQIGKGVVKNDAFHISAPSKTSEGLYACLQETLRGVSKEQVGFVNAHGTATLFNDQMESIAIQRAGLAEIPMNALKGYFGHTLGAAGILETILCMKAADEHIIIGTRGFEELGVSGHVNISAEHREVNKVAFVKMLSGFGGCNATMLATSNPQLLSASQPLLKDESKFVKTHHVLMTPTVLEIDGKPMEIKTTEEMSSRLTYIYKQRIGNYPKYYKMDGLSRLGFVASELLLQEEKRQMSENKVANRVGETGRQDRAVILFNRSSSIFSDKKFLASIADKDYYFPSPSVFVYTLPNIVTGEIAIRNGYHGETSFYVLADKDEEQMQEVLQSALLDSQTQSAITGWIDYEDEAHFEADLYIVQRN